MLQSIIAILGGLMASYSLIVTKRPESKDILDKIKPYQEWLGVFLTFWGVAGLLKILFGGSLYAAGGALGLVMLVAECVVGFLLAYPLISKLLFEKSESAKIKALEFRNKLVQYQVPAGVTLIILGILKLLRF